MADLQKIKGSMIEDGVTVTPSDRAKLNSMFIRFIYVGIINQYKLNLQNNIYT